MDGTAVRALATSHTVAREPATVHGYYVTPGNVAGLRRGAAGVNTSGENRGDGDSEKSEGWRPGGDSS